MILGRHVATLAYTVTAILVAAILIPWVFPGDLSAPSDGPFHTTVNLRPGRPWRVSCWESPAD
jgi:hypothetical protein